ncbi:MAG: diguanylate cyclase, partial [Rhodospirillales bacterium]|nr:diguanylate cyclase [Rhodospirillales bacterium]
MDSTHRRAGTVDLVPQDVNTAPSRAETATLRQRLDDLTRLVSDWVWETDATLRLTSVSDRAFEVIDMTPDELGGRRLTAVFDFADEHGIEVKLARQSPFRSVPCAVSTRAGERRYFQISGIPILDNELGTFRGYRGTASDVTRDHLAQTTLQRRDAVMAAVGDVAAKLLSGRDWHDTLPAIVEALGRAASVDSIQVFRINTGRSGDVVTVRHLQWTMLRGIEDDGVPESVAIPFRSTGLGKWAERLQRGDAVTIGGAGGGVPQADGNPRERHRGVLLVPILVDGHWWGYLRFDRREIRCDWAEPEMEALKVAAGILGAAIHRDRFETELRQQEAQLLYQAHHDQLTDLPNRVNFFDNLPRALSDARRNDLSLALVSIDLDQFKRLNESLGAAVGDDILRQVGRRLSAFLVPPDRVARLAGDEFVMLLAGEMGRERSRVLVPQILASLTAPYPIDGEDIYVHASIGVAVFPDNGQDAPSLLHCADTAMRCAKQIGGNTVQFFCPGKNMTSPRSVVLSQHLHHALERRQLELFYQPVVEAQSGKIVAAEALLRWRHPEFGLIPPNDFISLAEEGGLIEPIGDWVLREACRQNKEWRRLGLSGIRIAVNVSSRQLQRGQLLGSVFAALSGAGLP